jgi:hypothetical protein
MTLKLGIDNTPRMWDSPTMTTRADNKKRVVLPTAKPGDVFDIRSEGEGRFLLVRLAPVKLKARMNRTQCLKAITVAPLRPKMDWETLKAMTREP